MTFVELDPLERAAAPSFTRPAAQPVAETSQPTQQPAHSNVVHMPASHMAQTKPGEGRSRVSTADPNERFQDRRIPLSPAEDAELERLITAFASEMGAKVKGTHVGRAWPAPKPNRPPPSEKKAVHAHR
ncbi:MAG: hypothetical protein ACE5E5_15200, partial [Phycisphaerae bacterium]